MDVVPTPGAALTVLQQYDEAVRAKPMPQAGLRVETWRGVTALVGHFNFVSSWRFTTEEAAEVAQGMAKRFRGRGEGLMWHVYAHDAPPGLADHLSANGFIAEQTATLMTIAVDDACRTLAGGSDSDVRRVRDAQALDDYIVASGLAFGAQDTWQRQAYQARLDDPDLALYVAYVGGRPAAAGRLEADTRSGFGELFGGGVAPQHRQHGLYRSLVACRALAARDLGLRYLVTSARETSRPILQRLGFDVAGTKTCWVLKG